MKTRNLLIAAILLLGLSCAVWWANRHPSASTSSSATSISPKLANIPENEIAQIDLQKKDGPALVIERQKGKWVITSPQPWPADQEAVSSLASSLSPVMADSVVDAEAKGLNRYGLAAPSLTVTVHEKNGKTAQVIFGDDIPAGSLVYARVPGKPDVYAVSSSVKTSFDKSENDLRDKRLLTFDTNQITRVDLISGHSDMEFGKNNQNNWEILKPGPYRADSFQVEELVRNLGDAKMDLASDAASDKKASAEFADGKLAGTVKVTDSSGTQTLELRKNGSDYYAKSSVVPGVYKVSGDLATEVTKPVDDFRNKKIFDFGFNDPAKIDVQQGSAEKAYVRAGTDWKSNGKTMDPATVQALIDKLRDLTATNFLTAGFGNPDLSVAVTSNDGKQVEKAEFSKTANGYIARRENEPNTLYALDASAVNDILSASNAIKPAASSKKK
jgi:hypothetical protein